MKKSIIIMIIIDVTGSNRSVILFLWAFFRKVDHFGNVYFIIIVNIHNINI